MQTITRMSLSELRHSGQTMNVAGPDDNHTVTGSANPGMFMVDGKETSYAVVEAWLASRSVSDTEAYVMGWVI